MALDLKTAVVVITGASSGVGRAAALAFAREGSRLVLLARGEPALATAARECAVLGAEAVALPTDVSDADAVERAAAAAVARFGRIDVWVNVAGVGAVGGFVETPVEQHAQTIATNLLGYLHGAYAAVRRFKAQGSGVLICMNSVGGFAAAAYAPAYSASKFGVRGLCLALRGELASTPGVHVCEVYASFLDTPGIEHVANFTGARLRTVLVNDPDKVARVMVGLARRPRAEVMLDAPAAAIRLGASAAPQTTAWVLGRVIELYTRLAERAPVTQGATFAAAAGSGETHGGLKSPPLRIAAGLALGLGAAGLLALVTRRGGED